ncbi:MAG: hypothetical protein RR415_00265 [Ruthenibacterium sp.]
MPTHKHQNNPNLDKYIDFASKHIESISEEVNRTFNKEKTLIKAKILSEIKKMITPVPSHLEWKRGGCSYDASGELFEGGLVNMSQTVNDFLGEEYSGSTIATYTSGCGLSFCTYGDSLSDETMEIGEDVMWRCIRQCLEKAFQESVNDETFGEVMDSVHDDIYDNCLAADFFCWESAIEFVEIGELTLDEV